jgi:putative endonuclease
MFFVYVLRSLKDFNYYIGYTSDLEKRLFEHNGGISKSTAHRRPLELVYYEACISSKDAAHREKYLKTTYGHRFLKNRLKNYFEENIST